MLEKTLKLCLVFVFVVISLYQANKGFSYINEKSQANREKQSRGTSNINPDELKKIQKPEKQIVVTGPNELEMELVYVEPNSFIMGRDIRLTRLLSIINFEFQSNLDEGPPRKVTITKGYYLGKYKVTVGQYCEFLNSPDVNDATHFMSFNYWSRIIKKNGRFVPIQPELKDCNVSTVHWEGAKAFCEWLSRQTGRRFRLPTEAEWEFALRRPNGFYSPGGSDWFIGEWVSDYYDYYPRKDEIDPTGPKEPPDLWPRMKDMGPMRVLRVGSSRDFGIDANEGGIYGFRVLMEVDKDRIETKLSDEAIRRRQALTHVEFPRGGRLRYGSKKSPGKPLTDIKKIAAGCGHNLALKVDGSIVGWGSNDYNDATPPDGNDFIDIAAGWDHDLALKADGSIVGWGGNFNGQATPPDGNDYVAISSGADYSLALKSDGSIIGWGYNFFGQASPPDGNNFIAIAAGSLHSLALTADGFIIGWGSDAGGDLRPPIGNEFVAIAAGRDYSLALKADGSIVSWGFTKAPPKDNDFIAISAGSKHSLALKSDGSIVGWGDNYYGQATPPKGNDYIAIAAGADHSLALKADGTVVGWGANWAGQATPAK